MRATSSGPDAERPADGGTSRFPGRAVQQTQTWVGIAQAWRGEEIAPAQGRTHSVHQAQRPGLRVHDAIHDNARVPAGRDELDRQLAPAAVDVAHVLHGGKKGFGGRSGAEMGCSHQSG